MHVIEDLVCLDEEGVELPTLDDARERAIRGARELIAHEVARSGRVILHHRIEIADDDGSVLLTIAYGDVVRIEESAADASQA